MQDCKRYTLIALVLALFAIGVLAQDWRVKTNVAYLATATPNLAVENRFAEHWSWDLSVGWNPFTFSNNKKWKHVAVQPEVRYWLHCPFKGHFFGAHLLYSHFNAGGIKMPFGMFSELEQCRFQGNMGGVGIAYGYNWTLGKQKRWAIEAEIGVGYVYAHYDKYRCLDKCATLLATESKHLFMPTKLNVSVVYNFGKTDRLKNCRKSVVENDNMPAVVEDGNTPAVVEIFKTPAVDADTHRSLPVNQYKHLPYDKDSEVEQKDSEVEQVEVKAPAKQREYVYFPIASSEINRNYSGNAASLDSILNRIIEARKGGDANVKRIRIIGLASIDGPAAYNARIALARAEALAKYLQTRTALPMSTFEAVNGGEGWEYLRQKVEQSSEAELPQKQAVLSIIDSEADVDRREWRLKQLDNGSVWMEMKNSDIVRSQRAACVVEINP